MDPDGAGPTGFGRSFLPCMRSIRWGGCTCSFGPSQLHHDLRQRAYVVDQAVLAALSLYLRQHYNGLLALP